MIGPNHHPARALLLLPGLAVLLGTACRAPGEPPSHPGIGAYRDIIRREADSTHSALATARLLILTARAQGLPGTYARVTLRSTAADLQHVVIDLNQITPPAAARVPQTRLKTIANHDAVLLAHLQHHWGDHASRQQALQQVTRDANELDRTLEHRLEQG